MTFPLSIFQKSLFVVFGLVAALGLANITIGSKSNLTATAQNRPFQPIPIAVTTVPGMSLALGSAAVVRERGLQEVRFNLNNQGGEKLEMLEIMLFDFALPNRLERVEGKQVRTSANAGQTTQVYFPLNRLIEAGHALALFVRSASGANDVQDFDYLELIRDLSRKGGLNGNLPNLNLRKVDKNSANTGGIPCHSLYRLTKDLLKEQRVAPYPVFSCQPGSGQFEIRFETSLVKRLTR